jgi:hypothetical protein
MATSIWPSCEHSVDPYPAAFVTLAEGRLYSYAATTLFQALGLKYTVDKVDINLNQNDVKSAHQKKTARRRPESREETPKEAYAAIACCTAIMVRPLIWFNEKGR